MYLSPADEDRLRVFTAAELARRTLARGAPAERAGGGRAGLRRDAPGGAGRGLVRRRARGRAARRLAGPTCCRASPTWWTRSGWRFCWTTAPGWWCCASRGGEPGRRTGRERSGTRTERSTLHDGRERRRLTVRNGSGPAGQGRRRTTRSGGSTRGWSSTGTPLGGCRLDIPAGHSVRWAPGEAKEVGWCACPGWRPVILGRRPLDSSWSRGPVSQ